jgi:hypothetical protein
MEQAFKFTKPGGWVEFQDFDMRFYSIDGTFVPGCVVDEWTKEVILGLQAMDREAEPGSKLEKWVTDAGFTNVNYERLPIPVGIWPKDRRMVGLWAMWLKRDSLLLRSILTLQTERNWRL